MQGTATPSDTSATGEDIVHVASEFQRVLEDLAAAQGRLEASLLLVAVLVFGIFVLPAVASRVRTLAKRLQTEQTSGSLEHLARYAPTSFAGLLRRTAQLTVLLAVVTSFLVVWGLVDVSSLVAGLVAAGGPSLIDALASLFVVALAFVLSDQFQQRTATVSERVDGMTDHQTEILLRVGQVAIFVTAGATILGIWDVNISGLLIGAGFLGIVVGFAARKTLGSLIAGFVLMFSRPFTIGDWVEIGDNEGIVTDITIFNTRLENFDGEFIVLPNDQVSDRSVTNRSQKGLLRLRTDVGVDYDVDPNHAREVAMDAMSDLDEIAETPPPQVIPKEFGDSAVTLEMRYWIDHPTPPRKWQAVSAVVRSVKSAFDEEGIAIPFPQRTVSGRAVEDADAGQNVVPNSATGNGHGNGATQTNGDGAVHPDGNGATHTDGNGSARPETGDATPGDGDGN